MVCKNLACGVMITNTNSCYTGMMVKMEGFLLRLLCITDINSSTSFIQLALLSLLTAPFKKVGHKSSQAHNTLSCLLTLAERAADLLQVEPSGQTTMKIRAAV